MVKSMLRWSKRLYTDKSIRNPDKIRERIDGRRLVPGVYLLTLSDHADQLLEIVPAASLVQKPLRELCPPIIGMAGGKTAAVELAAYILEEVYRKTGGFCLEEYMKNG